MVAVTLQQLMRLVAVGLVDIQGRGATAVTVLLVLVVWQARAVVAVAVVNAEVRTLRVPAVVLDY
jgi:hypothetical protein